MATDFFQKFEEPSEDKVASDRPVGYYPSMHLSGSAIKSLGDVKVGDERTMTVRVRVTGQSMYDYGRGREETMALDVLEGETAAEETSAGDAAERLYGE